jgi:ABC-2 type transport system ATP-binding protein
VIARGRIVADGSPAELRAAGGGALVQFRLPARAALPKLPGQVTRDQDWVTVRTDNPDGAVQRLAASSAPWSQLQVSPPSLDDWFLAVTGQIAADEITADEITTKTEEGAGAR